MLLLILFTIFKFDNRWQSMALFNLPSIEQAFKELFLKKKDAPLELTADTVMRGLTGLPHAGADRYLRSYLLFVFEFALNTLKVLFIFLPFVVGKGLGRLAEKMADTDSRILVPYMGKVGYLIAGLAVIGSGLTYLASLIAFAGAFTGACLLASTDTIKAAGEHSNSKSSLKVTLPVTVLTVIAHAALLFFSWPAYLGLFGLKFATRAHEELQKSAYHKDCAEKVYMRVNVGSVTDDLNNQPTSSPQNSPRLFQAQVTKSDDTALSIGVIPGAST
ncbi:hypothetical protein [Legionella geestiana]|nr:hypothetical protein [Legionella geestiana]QBS11434.1 hypothetical protein E4T54_01015 [Legionella geestiana]